MNYFDTLPDELRLLILQMIDDEMSLLIWGQVCKRHYNEIQEHNYDNMLVQNLEFIKYQVIWMQKLIMQQSE